MILAFVKEHLHPSSPFAILIVLAIGVAGLYLRPSSRWPRRYLLSALLFYWLMATRIGATLLVAGLGRGYTSIASRDEARGAEAVVVLGGGAGTFTVGGQTVGTLSMSSILRALEGARIAKLIDARLVIASGGVPRPDLVLKPESEMLSAMMVTAGVPPDRIIQESSSTTTREEALLIPPMLRERGIAHFVLVTSPPHMGRSLALFRAQGVEPIPSVSPMRSEHLPPPSLIIPDPTSLIVSDEAIYDYMAWIYNWWEGWMKAEIFKRPRAR